MKKTCVWGLFQGVISHIGLLGKKIYLIQVLLGDYHIHLIQALLGDYHYWFCPDDQILCYTIVQWFYVPPESYKDDWPSIFITNFFYSISHQCSFFLCQWLTTTNNTLFAIGKNIFMKIVKHSFVEKKKFNHYIF